MLGQKIRIIYMIGPDILMQLNIIYDKCRKLLQAVGSPFSKFWIPRLGLVVWWVSDLLGCVESSVRCVVRSYFVSACPLLCGSVMWLIDLFALQSYDWYMNTCKYIYLISNVFKRVTIDLNFKLVHTSLSHEQFN